jgi:hypothetical protein
MSIMALCVWIPCFLGIGAWKGVFEGGSCGGKGEPINGRFDCILIASRT